MKIRHLILCAAITSALFVHADAFFPRGIPTTQFSPLAIGAGGYLTSFDIKCDASCTGGSGTATKVARADTYGAWIYNNTQPNCGNAARTGCWQQLITPSSMPLSARGNSTTGVYEIVIAPSNTSHLYMYWGDGNIYSSTNKGKTWILAPGWTTIAADPNAGSRLNGQFMAVDPANENVLITGTQGHGVWYTLDGGNTFTQIPTGTIPAGTGTNGNVIAFDPTSSVTGGKTQGIYVGSYGNGVYHTSTGVTGTWSLTPSSPTTWYHMIVDGAGSVWVANLSISVFKSGSWSTLSEPLPGGSDYWAAMAYDTNNCTSSTSCTVAFAADNGRIDVTRDDGTTFTGAYSIGSQSSPDIPWLAATNESFLAAGNIGYDPTQANVLGMSMGIGFIQGTIPATAGGVAWVYYSAAVEQLNSNWSISPPGCSPLFVFYDRPVMRSINPTIYPSTSYNTQIGIPVNNIAPGWSADYAALNPSTIVAEVDTNSGVSSDCGATWNKWTTLPQQLALTGGAVAFSGGSIAASTSTNWMVSIADFGSPYYTKDGGATWIETDPPGIPASSVVQTSSSTTGSTVLNFASVPTTLISGLGAGAVYTASDATNFNAIPNITVVSATSTTVTLASSVTVPTGHWIRFSVSNGWPFAQYTRAQNICSDKVNSGIFYAYNAGPAINAALGGIWKNSSGGDPAFWKQEYTSVFPNSGFGRLQCVPGNAGHIFYSSGPNNGNFYECVDSSPLDLSGTITCTAFSGVANVRAYGFGLAKPGGGGFPSIYIFGSVSGVIGYYRSVDHGATWQMLAPQYGPPTLDNLDLVMGDMNTYGRVYICFTGSACQWGQYNYLLNRDLHHDNDNSPAFLSHVA